MKTLCMLIAVTLIAVLPGAAQMHPTSTVVQQVPQPAARPSRGNATLGPIEKKVEAFLRNLYAWGPKFRLQFTSMKESEIPGIYKVTISVSTSDQSDSAVLYVTRDGRYLIRGDVQDMNADLLAEVRSKINLADTPSKGAADARVVIVEYADYECPSCRQLDRILRSILPKYPEAKLYYKNFPLSQIHPWAMTAAIAGRCAYQQSPAAFWKVHDAIFDNQDVISAEIAWQKMVDYATHSGLDPAVFKACMADPGTAEAVQATVQEGMALRVANTPTVFVNGRRMIGADTDLLEQYIKFDLQVRPSAPPSAIAPEN